MQIVDFIGQNIFWVLLAIFAIFVIITSYRANSAFDRYLKMRERYIQMPSTLNISAKTLGKEFSKIHFNGIIKLEKTEQDGPDGSYNPKSIVTGKIDYSTGDISIDMENTNGTYFFLHFTYSIF